MKVRLSEKLVQFRLSHQDLNQLEDCKQLELAITLTPNSSLKFKLMLSEQTTPILESSLGTVQVHLSGTDFQVWNQSHEIEWELRFSESPLIFLIEKDLKDLRKK